MREYNYHDRWDDYTDGKDDIANYMNIRSLDVDIVENPSFFLNENIILINLTVVASIRIFFGNNLVFVYGVFD